MAYGSDRDGGDPRGPICPGCQRPIEGEPITQIISSQGSVKWHAICAWEKFFAPQFNNIMRRLGRGWEP